MKQLHAAPVALLLFAALGVAATAHAEKTPSCITWSGQTVATAVGYNHVVTIDNGCAKPASCSISTDVAPSPIQASVAPGQRAELVTYRGSPSYQFTAKVTCSLQ